MKSKDQQLMEEAYVKISLVKEETVDDFNSRMIQKELEHQQDDVVDKDEVESAEVDKDEEAFKDSSHSGIDEETTQMYYSALKKFENNEITSQQWYDICAKLLGDLMEKNKDVFIRLKDR